MKWIWLLVLLLLITPVAGLKENFQTYDTSDFIITAGGDPAPARLKVLTNNNIVVHAYPSAQYVNIKSKDPYIFTYLAFDLATDLDYSGIEYLRVYFYDSGNNLIFSSTPIGGSTGRTEFKIVGGSVSQYTNGLLYKTYTPALSVNPSYFYIVAGNAQFSVYIDNIITGVVGSGDNYITGSLPSNWTIQRDLINPAATGVYAWSGTAWVLVSSNYFYGTASKETTDSKTVTIRHMGGTPINTTSGLTANYNVLTYDLAQFLSTSTSVGVTPPDGLYSVSWDSMSPPNWFADTFWIISSGATVNWGQDTYAQSDVATITYAISTGYYDTAVYDYALVVTDVYGTAKSTITISAQTGTQSVTLAPATFADGVYYVQLKATKKSDSSVYVMNYDSMTLVGYVLFNGYVMNAENGTVLSNAYVNITQGSSNKGQFSIAGGLWNSTNNWLSGTSINLTTNKTGYTSDIIVFTPLAGRSINLNISLVPSAPSYTGIAVGGVVRDNVYYNPVVGATYHVKNVTEYTATTNIAGYARVDSLPNVNNILYDVWSTKSGFASSNVSQIVAVGV